MADSENSRTLPSISCRNRPIPVESVLEAVAGEQVVEGRHGGDKTLVRWQAWWRAYLELSRLGRIQQRLEGELFKAAPAPLDDNTAPGETVATPIQAADTPRDGISSADTRKTTLAEVARCHHEWDAVDERIGYSRAKAAEDVAAAIEQRFAVELCSNPATSAIAVAAKLHCIVTQGEPGPYNSEFPWPQLRAVLADLLLIGATKPSTTLNH